MTNDHWSDHCHSPVCDQSVIDRAPPVCECDCVVCTKNRRPPETVLIDAYQSINEPHQDFGDVGGIFMELAESMASVLRAREKVDAEATKRSADIVRQLLADLNPNMDPPLAAVIRKALDHAVKKIEEAGR